MSKKISKGSVRPSPTASILGIIALAAILIIALSSFSGMGGGFMAVFVLFGLAGIIYYIVNLSSFSKSDRDKIPVTAEDVIQVDTSEEVEGEPSGKDFETRLRKVESLKTDGLITEDEYRQKRDEILKEKW